MAYLIAAGLAIQILFTALIGFRLECIHIDTLHTVGLGNTSHVIGNTLWHMACIKMCFGGTTIGATVIALNAYLKTWYKDTGCSRRSQGAITPERLRTSGDWPKLKAKATATREAIHFCIHVMETFWDLADPRSTDSKMYALCKLLRRFYILQDTASQFFLRKLSWMRLRSCL